MPAFFLKIRLVIIKKLTMAQNIGKIANISDFVVALN